MISDDELWRMWKEVVLICFNVKALHSYVRTVGNNSKCKSWIITYNLLMKNIFNKCVYI